MKFKLVESFDLENEQNRIKDVLDILEPIRYGFISDKDGTIIDDRDWIESENLKGSYTVNDDPEITINNKLGICQDQALATEYLINKYHPEDKVQLYALTKSPKGHCVACYCHDNKWYYLENAWDKERGLHGPFDSQDEVENYLKSIYYNHHKDDTPEDSMVELTSYEQWLEKHKADK